MYIRQYEFHAGFEWDEAKRYANLAKHRVDFTWAIRVFDGPVGITEDRRREYGEPRFRATGLAGHQALTVVDTLRGSHLRVISARRASRREEATYRAVRPAHP